MPQDDHQLELIEKPARLKRADALVQLDALIGQDLRPLADQFDITVWKSGRKNKGWAGHVVERYLGQSPNSDKAADFGDWELKVVPLIAGADGTLRPKESMAIAMFTAHEIEQQSMADSHFLEKLKRLVVVARLYVDGQEDSSLVLGVVPFDLSGPLYAAIEEDYEDIRWLVRNDGINAVHGGVGRFVQARVKGGAGAGTGGHCMYARTQLVAYILGLTDTL